MKKQMNILALTPIRNEEEMIPGYLNNIFLVADAAIVLNDGSSDRSVKLLKHKKIIKILQKQHSAWNDLENRRLLLKEAYTYSPKWILWIDADERFIAEDIKKFQQQLCRTKADVISFPLYHCWDSEDYYRVDYPLSTLGVQTKKRMLRNTGHYSIPSSQKFHFELTPKGRKEWASSLRIKHLGNISLARRKLRYKRYLAFDPNNTYNPVGYSHLIDNHVIKKGF